MNERTRIDSLPDFDPAEHLRDKEDIAAYLAAVIEEGDYDELGEALGTVARSRGMTEIARESGLAREALYRALRPGASPRFDTIARVIRALGLSLTVRTRTEEETTRPAA